MQEISKSETREKNYDIRIMATSLHDLLCVLQRMKEGIIPKTEEIEKAVQNSIKELCTAILEHL